MQIEQDPGRLLRSFLDVAMKVADGRDEREVLIALVTRGMEITRARYAAALTVDAEGRIRDFVHEGLEPELVALLPHLPEGRGLLGAVLARRETVRVDELSSHPDSVGFPGNHVSMERFLGLPLERRGELLGALYLCREASEAPFTDDDEEKAEAIAAVGALTLDNARLFGAESARAERAALLRHVASKVRKSLTLEEVLDATVETLGRAARVDRCLIRLATEDDPNMLDVAAQWVSTVEPIRNPTALPFPVSNLAGRTRSTQWTRDLRAEQGLMHSPVPAPEGPQVTAVLATPLEWGDTLLGVITFQTEDPRVWSLADRALIEAAAREVSIAIHHARLYEDAVSTATRLRDLDDMRSDFISMVSHELRSPMTVVAGIADILDKRRHKLSEERQSELIATLGREARRLTRLVSEVLDLEAIDQGRMELHMGQVDMSALCSEAIADAGEAARTKLIVEPGRTQVVGDYDKIKQVLLNLISNAAKFSGEEGAITVSVRPAANGVQVSVADEGPGIPDEYKPRLFQRFSRVQATGARKPGSGLGLYLARIIIEGHNGEIWCDSTLGEGTTFTFRLPR